MEIIVENNFDDIYVKLLKIVNDHPQYLVSPRGINSKETTHLGFTLTNPCNSVTTIEARKFKQDFAQKFFQWMMKGETDISLLYEFNSNAKKYDDNTDLPATFSTAYGPRIVRQIVDIIRLFEKDIYTRRAVIHILEEHDKILYEVVSNTEYPCTDILHYLIRDNYFHAYTVMRSNNIAKTICYDVYNFCGLQIHLWEKLLSVYPQLKIGNYHHYMISAHFFESEQEMVDKVLYEVQS